MSKRRLVHRCLMGAVLAVPATLLGIYSLGHAQEPPSAAFPSEAELRPVLQIAQADGTEVAAAHPAAKIDLPGGAWPPAPKDGEPKLRESVGVDSCIRCHAAKTSIMVDIPGFGKGDGTGPQDDNWALLNELLTWASMDKHHGSYVALFNERSQKMAEVMGLIDENGKSFIHRDVRCIACHSGVPIRDLEIDQDAKMAGWEGIITEDMVKDDIVNRGVSCEGCHGEAGDTRELEGWETEHISKRKWRFMDPAYKADHYGYFDIRSPVLRTKMCLSCHLGNVEEGRVVTHEMMAAGHPPLPGFEIETFSLQEPQHWRNFHEKSPDIRKEFLEETAKREENGKTVGWRTTEYREGDLHNTRDLLIGSVINLSELVRLSLNMADPNVSVQIGSDKWTKGTEGQWPEFSLYACFACHNDLQDEGWRLQRTPIGTPGRPPLHEWPFVLAKFALQNTGDGNATILAQVREVQQAAVDGPFGNKPRLMAAGNKLIGMLEAYAQKLETMPLPKAMAPKLLKGLVDMTNDSPASLDYDSARQVVWAFRTIYEDAKGISMDADELYAKEEIEKRVGWYDSESEKLTPVQKKLAEFSGLMMMDLRKGSRADKKINGQDRPFLQWDAKLALPAVGAYNPESFKAKFKELHGMISNENLASGK